MTSSQWMSHLCLNATIPTFRWAVALGYKSSGGGDDDEDEMGRKKNHEKWISFPVTIGG